MPFSVDFLPAEKLVCVTNAGILSLSDYQRGAEQAVALMDKQAVWRCLIDNRELNNQVSVSDIFKLPTFFTHIGLPRTVRAAILISDATPKREDHEFFETVCVNKGYGFRLFTNRDEAPAWLTS